MPCRQGHDLDAPGIARTGVRGDGSRYRYCRLCEQSRRTAQHAPRDGGVAMSFAEIGRALGIKTTEAIRVYKTAMAKMRAATPEQTVLIRGLLALANKPNAMLPAGAGQGCSSVSIPDDYYTKEIDCELSGQGN